MKIFLLLLMFVSSVAIADTADCSRRGPTSPGPYRPECWASSKNPPKTKAIPITAAAVGAVINTTGVYIVGAATGSAVLTSAPLLITTAVVSGAAFYVYTDSFKGPVYERNEREYVTSINKKLKSVGWPYIIKQ